MSRTTQSRLLLISMVCSGAILSFSLQPLLGRMLASSFGSAVHVWLTAMVFFQGALFVGYLYAHLVASRVGPGHLLLLLVPLALLPPAVPAQPAPDAPTLMVLWALFRHGFLPYFAVATTAVVAQSWLARSDLEGRVEPYPLYSASNVGSLLGLLGYPLLIEPFTGLSVQSWMWTGLYLLHAGIVVATWFLVRPGPPEVLEQEVANTPAPTPLDHAAWMLLAAVPSGFLLAVTNAMVLEVGSVPLIWVAPLAAYLCTFIVAFRDGALRWRRMLVMWPEIGLAALIIFLTRVGSWQILPAHLVVLVGIAFLSHLELYARRPHPRYLTRFYLAVALGGWLGGLTVNLAAPVLFTDVTEYPVLALAFLLVMGGLTARRTLKQVFDDGRPMMLLRGTALAVLSLAVIKLYVSWFAVESEFALRNFYGFFTVRTVQPEAPGELPRRVLLHGSTVHGLQYLDPEHALRPTGYFAEGGCIERTYALVESPREIAVMGLGAGVTALFAGPEDHMRFYEIDPDNEKVARDWFTYLDSAGDRVEIVTGDGRLELLRSSHRYDLLHMDAFSGDGVPFHLLTVEAIETYLDRLEPDGVLLFHVSNRFFDLRPPLADNAEALGLSGLTNGVLVSPEDPFAAHAICVVLSRDPARLEPLRTDDRWQDLEELAGDHPWTDDYIDMLSALRFRR